MIVRMRGNRTIKQLYGERHGINTGIVHRDHQSFVVSFAFFSICDNCGHVVILVVLRNHITEIKLGISGLITPLVRFSYGKRACLFGIRNLYIGNLDIVTFSDSIDKGELHF